MASNREFVEALANDREEMAYCKRLAARYVGPDEAEAMVQEAFAKALNAPPADKARNPSAWFRAIVKNTARDTYRRNRLSANRGDSLEVLTEDGARMDKLGVDPHAIDPQEVAERKETIAEVQQAIGAASLSNSQRFALDAFYGGASHEEVAAAAQQAGLTTTRGETINQKHVKSDLHRAREKVGEQLEANSPHPRRRNS